MNSPGNDSNDDLFDFDADVLVVGTGGSGFAAAISAAAEGRSVIVFERNDHIGGTTGASGGTAWIPNNRSLRDQGKEDPRDFALKYMCRLAYPQYYVADHPTLGLPDDAYELIATFYDRGSEAIDHLTDIGVFDLMADTRAPDLDNPMEMPSGNLLAGFPDYGAELEEEKLPTGRHLFPRPGTPGMVDQLEAGAAAHGVQVVLGHQVRGLIQDDDGAAVGLELQYGHNARIARARRGVIFASGGYAHNVELVRRYLPGRVFGTCATLGAQGDFVQIGIEAGAKLGNMKNAWWKQVPLEAALRSPTPPSVWLPWGDAMIHVNKYGSRVVDEKMPYHDRSQAHLVYDPTRREYPNLALFMIFDDTVATSHSRAGMRQPLPAPGEPIPDWIISADTLEELAAQIDARLAANGDAVAGLRLDVSFTDTLASTIERFNGFATTGVDEDFGRGSAPIGQAWNGPNREGSPNPTMAPFAPQGPYHAVIVCAGILDTNGGPVTNTSAQVLNHYDTPIPGLYGAGNCVASPAGQAYWGPGATIGLGITYGYIAGLNSAAEPERDFPF